MQPGHVVADRFVIEARIGAGGMGDVYRARDRATSGLVALKTMRADASDARFAREARLLREIDHPAIVRYVADGPGFLAMEWLEGEDLARRLVRGALSIDETLALARRLCEGLAAAHARGIVHRDLKPSNILLEHDRVEGAKLLDFGIARGAALGTRATGTGAVLGTPGYMAPEQARGATDVGQRADVFSLGCVLFECIAARPAFVGEHPIAVLARILLEDAPRLVDLVPHVPRGLDDLVAAALCKDPSGRPAGAREVIDALENIDRRSSAVASAPSITSAEQGFAVVVLVGGPASDAAATIAAEDDAGTRERVIEIARAHGAAAEALASGSVVLLWRGAAAATDLVARASACAIALRQETERPIAVSAGRAELGGRVPIGPALDRAASLVRRARSIAIDDVAAALVDDRFEVRGGETLELVANKRGDGGRTLLGRETPCVGRDAELSLLASLVAHAASDHEARCAVVTAPPGLGKTRVRREFLRQIAARTDPVEFWLAVGDEVGAHATLGVVTELVRRAVGVVGGEPADVRRSKLNARIAQTVAPDDRERIAAFLGELLGTTAVDDRHLGPLRDDPAAVGEQLRAAFCDFLGAQCAIQPLVLVLDDLQWGDQPSVRFIDAALSALHDRPFFVLAFARPEIDERFPDLWTERGVTRLALPPLPRRAAERLARLVLGERPDLASIVERAGGNAFFLEELIRATAEGRSEGLPETVVAMVQVRLEAFESDARRFLRAASVFGQTFWEDGVAALAGDVDVRRWIEQLVEREVVERRARSSLAGQRELVFRHAFVREAAYAMLPDPERVLGHRLAGEWLERAGASDPLALATHFEKAGLADRAARALLSCAHLALGAQDLPSVVLHVRRAAELAVDDAVRMDALRLQSHTLSWQGRMIDVDRTAGDALRGLDPGHPAWPLLAAWSLFAAAMRGDPDRAVAGATRLLSHEYRHPMSQSEAMALFVAPFSMFYVGRRDLAEALLVQVRSIRASSPADEPVLNGWRLFIDAHLALFRDADPWRTYERAARGWALLSEYGEDPGATSSAHQALGAFLLALGDFEEGERVIGEALATAERGRTTGWAVWWARVAASLAPSRRRALVETRDLQRACIEDNAANGALLLEGLARMGLATTLTMMGELDAAEAESARAVAQLAPFPPLRAAALGVRSSLLLRRGDSEGALACASAGRADIELGGTWIVPDYATRLAEAEALRALGRTDDARTAIAATRDRLLDRAACIPDLAHRERFLRRIRVHARVLELASAWTADR